MPSSSIYKYSFRPFTVSDLPMMAKWLVAPHVARWWGDDVADTLEDIEACIQSVSVKPYIIELAASPVGYIQSYDPHLEKDHPYQDQPIGTIGIDLTIGEFDLIGKGHGPRIIDEFVRKLFAEGATRVIIDPDPANLAAIRAYEKAGFKVFDIRTTDYGPALMMFRNARPV
jgi:aminoglycoside 6'-N-acetyltransferase